MTEIATLMQDPQAWASLLTLTVMEIVLGIDNLVFIAILTNKLPEATRGKARRLGISLALILRLLLLGTLVFIVGLTRPVLTLMGHDFSWRDLILAAGGLFLVWRATSEIHHTVQPAGEDGGHDDSGKAPAAKAGTSFAAAIVQVLALDVVFSIDSILTAIGMTDQLPIMCAAVIIAVGLMMVASGPLAAFINKNPSIVMLALGFLLMIGMILIAEGFGQHVPKGYIYAAMAFSGFVEGLNMLARARRRAVRTAP